MRPPSPGVPRAPAAGRLLLMSAGVSLALASSSLAAGAYLRASIDSTGQLRIVTESGEEIAPRKDPEQAGFDQVAISSGRRTVGWLALYPNCCTSYPIPLKLVTYTGGRVRTFMGSGLPIWRWRFLAGGRRVAFEQETVHGGIGIHYELRDVATGRLVAEYDPPDGRDDRPVARRDVPPWVAQLDAGAP